LRVSKILATRRPFSNGEYSGFHASRILYRDGLPLNVTSLALSSLWRRHPSGVVISSCCHLVALSSFWRCHPEEGGTPSEGPYEATHHLCSLRGYARRRNLPLSVIDSYSNLRSRTAASPPFRNRPTCDYWLSATR
jgi:hypothetical protein